MKRFEEGGYTGDDPIVKYRMGMIDAKGNDLTKSKKETSVDTKQETSDDLDPYGAANKKPVAVEKTVVKTKVTPSSKLRDFDTTETEVVTPKKSSLKELRDVVGTSSLPKSFTEAGGNMSAKKSNASMPSMKIRLPDPLANFDSRGKRLQSRDFDYKKGGSVKTSSASKRADGIAQRGKTKGKMC